MSDRRGLGVSRESFLATVRAALKKPARTTDTSERSGPRAGTPMLPEVDESIMRLARPSDELVTLFTRRATESGMNVLRVPGGSWVAPVLNLCKSLGVSLAAVSQEGATDSAGAAPAPSDARSFAALRRELVSAGIAVLPRAERGGVDALFDADVGITDCLAGIAESGTIVVKSDARRSRGTFIVPPVHVAILGVEQILPDLIDFWPALARGAGVPTSLVFITGPSKTADIEGVLITGVHGPREVYIVLVEAAGVAENG